jgi:Domain of unknown function (DUF5060)
VIKQTASFLAIFFSITSFAAAVEIGDVNIFTTPVPQWGKLEAEFVVDGEYDNPYNTAEIRVDAVVGTPRGGIHVVPAFYYQEFDISLDSENLREVFTPLADPTWRFRYSPQELGTYTFSVEVSTPTGAATSATYSFDVTAPVDDGFVRPDLGSDVKRYLRFDSGRPYIPIGVNVDWPSDNTGIFNLDMYYDKVAVNGGNWTRLWMTQFASGITIEWGDDHSSGLYHGLNNYSLEAAYRLDRIFELWAQYGIYGQVALNIHSQYETTKWSSWSENPLNAENGGPLESSADLWDNAEANRYINMRTRYMLARYGYCPNILAWEIFNEVDGIAGYQSTKAINWQRNMEALISSLDPANHIVTTSYALTIDINPDQDWDYAGYEMIELHSYHDNPIESLPQQFELLQNYEKPIIVGEYGIDWLAENNNEDPDGIHLRNGAWTAIMSGYAGTTMSWWWYDYLIDNDLWSFMLPISLFLQDEDLSRYPAIGIGYESNSGELELFALSAPDRVVAWVHDKDSTWGSTVKDSLPDHEGESIEIAGLTPGEYKISFWDTQQGIGIISEVTTRTDEDNDNLILTLPSFRGDVALKITPVFQSLPLTNDNEDDYKGWCSAAPDRNNISALLPIMLFLLLLIVTRGLKKRISNQ